MGHKAKAEESTVGNTKDPLNSNTRKTRFRTGQLARMTAGAQEPGLAAEHLLSTWLAVGRDWGCPRRDNQ